jgi:1,4-dihydroxy-6-naphthoate synthase
LQLNLAFSPCPNDTFIFDALVHQKIDTKEYTFTYALEDVETLNQWASQNKMDITKISFAASCFLQKEYALLQSGAALGKGVGPLLISNKPSTNNLNNIKIAIPGEKTTAHFLFNYYGKIIGEKIFMPFHEIENWVLNEKADEKRLGVIIHENRFTYQEKGLHLIQDLGAYWEGQTSLPIPLGGIFIKSSLPQKVKEEVDLLIQESVQYAFNNYTNSLPIFVTNNAQEMNETIMWQHIKLYVNNYSVALGEDGQKAIELMRKLLEPNI